MTLRDLPEVEVLTLDDDTPAAAAPGHDRRRDRDRDDRPRRVWPAVLIVAAVLAVGAASGLGAGDDAERATPSPAPTTPSSLGPLPDVARDDGDVVLRAPDGFGLVVAAGADAMRLTPAGLDGRITDVVSLGGGRWVALSEGRAVLLFDRSRPPVDLGPANAAVPAAGGEGAWLAHHDAAGPVRARLVDGDGVLRTGPLDLPPQRLLMGGGSRLLLTGPGRLLEWWDPATGATERLSGAARPVGVHPAGAVAVVSPECTACPVHVRPTGATGWMMSSTVPGVQAVGRGAFSTSGRELAVPVSLKGDDGVVVFDIDTKRTELLRLPGRPADVEWVPGGRTVVVLDDGGHLLTRWDVGRDLVEHLAVVDQGL